MSDRANKIKNRANFVNAKEYKLFKHQYPKTNIDYNTFISVLKASTLAIRDSVLDNPLGFKLPHSLGYIAVDKFKSKKSYSIIDWPNTLKLGRHVPLTNFHSFGYMYKIKLYPNTKLLPMRNYAFKAHRHFNRALAKNIKENLRQYVTIDSSCYSRRFNIDNLIKNTDG